jgi:hypothetical protein
VNPRTTGILLLVLAALGAFVWFYEIQGETARKEKETAAKRLFPGFEPTAVEWVELTTSDGRRARLERRDGQWRLVQPLDAQADEFAADAIAAALAQLGSEAVYEQPQPLEVYGLDNEEHDVRFRAAGAEHVLRIGKRTPVGGHSYAWVGGQSKVYAVPGYAVNALVKAVDELREKRVLRFDVGTAQRVKLAWDGGHVVLAKGEKDWRIEEPIQFPADQTTLDELLNDLAFLRASGFVDEPTAGQKKALEKPELEVEVETKPAKEGEAGGHHVLAIGAREAGEGSDRLARADGSTLFRIPSARVQDFPRDVEAYRFRELSRFPVEEAKKLEMVLQDASGPLTITAVHGDEGWSSTPEKVAPEKLATMVDELSRLRAKKILKDAADGAESKVIGLDPPHARFTVSGEKGQLAQVDLGAVRDEGIIARSSAGPIVYQLLPSVADYLPVDAPSLRERFLEKPAPAPAAQPPAAGSQHPGPGAAPEASSSGSEAAPPVESP